MSAPDIRNLAKADPVAIREAFSMLVDDSADIVDPDTFDTMSERDRRRVLLRMCDRLAADDGVMPPETCEALDMLPGNIFAAGAARARTIAQAKEATNG